MAALNSRGACFRGVPHPHPGCPFPSPGAGIEGAGRREQGAGSQGATIPILAAPSLSQEQGAKEQEGAGSREQAAREQGGGGREQGAESGEQGVPPCQLYNQGVLEFKVI